MESHFNNGNRTNDGGGLSSVSHAHAYSSVLHIEVCLRACPVLCLSVWHLTYSLILICSSFLAISLAKRMIEQWGCVVCYAALFFISTSNCVCMCVFIKLVLIHKRTVCNPNKMRKRIQIERMLSHIQITVFYYQEFRAPMRRWKWQWQWQSAVDFVTAAATAAIDAETNAITTGSQNTKYTKPWNSCALRFTSFSAATPSASVSMSSTSKNQCVNQPTIQQ